MVTVGFQVERQDTTMLRNAQDLQGFSIQAADGEIGTVEQFYFDDETWVIRYLTINTGGWLGGRLVLISPISILGQPDWRSKRVNVALTKRQVENSPSVDAHQPVSRQHEIEYLGYFGYPFYWGDSNLGGPESDPAGLADSHLRSAEEVTGYSIAASDGEIGHLDGFVVDEDTWAIRYIEVATRSWWPGKRVLVSPAWIERVSWPDSKIYAGLSREAIQGAPEYLESMPITRAYETRLYLHYGRPPYWLTEGAPKQRNLELAEPGTRVGQ
jgi:hypothetical protein